jgi:solute carrier family 25 ornithine transporter 2/15
MMREMPGYFFFFLGYESSKSLLTSGKPESAGLIETILSGGVGGLCLWTAIFPFDVTKSRIQVDSLKDSMSSVLLKVYRKEGISGLYKGLTPTLIRTFPSTAALFVVYEYSKQYMTVGSQKLGILSLT